MCGFILVEFLMFAALSQIEDPIQKSSIVSMFFNISLAMFIALIGGNVIEKVKVPSV